MNILKLELKKTNIKPYFLSAIAVFVCIMGLTYILAWVPHLDSGDKNAAILFSTYRGIAAICNAIALMSFSILASAMGRGSNPLIQLSHKSQICCLGKSGGNFAFHQHHNVLN